MSPRTETVTTTPAPKVTRRDVQMFDALASQPRATILERLAVRPMSVADLERDLHLPRVTLRYHLSVLLGQGLVEEVELPRRQRIGRPPRMYRAARHAVVSGYPKRRFEILSDIALDTLVQEVGEARALDSLRRRGREMGHAMIQDVGAEKAVTRWTPEAFERFVLAGRFQAEGAQVEVLARTEGGLAYRSAYCPFLELAEKKPHIVCDALDVGFHEGVDDALGGVRTERLTCMAHGAQYCEYRMRWRGRRGKG